MAPRRPAEQGDVMTNTSIWTELCSPTEPYTLDRLQSVLGYESTISSFFGDVGPDVRVTTMRELSARAGSPTAARLGLTANARTVAIRGLLDREATCLYHPQLIEIWSNWLRSSDYRENYEAVGRAVDPIASIAAADTVALVRLGSELDRDVSARTAELPIVRYEAQGDLGRQLRIAGLADTLSLIAHVTA